MVENKNDFMKEYINSKYEDQKKNIDLFIETYQLYTKEDRWIAHDYYEELIPRLKYEILQKSINNAELFLDFWNRSEYEVQIYATKEIQKILNQLLNNNDITKFRETWLGLNDKIKIASTQVATQALKLMISMPKIELEDIIKLWYYVDEKNQKELFTLVFEKINDKDEISIDKIIHLFNGVSKEIQNENKELFNSFFTKKVSVDKLKYTYEIAIKSSRNYLIENDIQNIDRSLIIGLFDNDEINIKVKIKIYNMLREIKQFREESPSIFENIIKELLKDNTDIEIIDAWKSIQDKKAKTITSYYAEKIVDKILVNSELNVDFMTLIEICSLTSKEYQNKNLSILKPIFVKSANESDLQQYFIIRNINQDILEEVLKNRNIDIDKRITVWNYVDYKLEDVKTLTFENLLSELLKDSNANSKKIIQFWESSRVEKTQTSIENFLEKIIYEKEVEIGIIDKCWRHLKIETQNKHPEWLKIILNRYFDTTKEYNIKYEIDLWAETSEKVQKENVDIFSEIWEKVRKCYLENNYELPKGIIEKFWKNTATEIQTKNEQAFNQLLEDFITNNNFDYRLNYKELWKNTSLELQRKYIKIIDVIAEKLKKSDIGEHIIWDSIIADIWKNTDEIIQYENKERIISIAKKNESLWRIVPSKIINEFFIQFKNESFKDSEKDEKSIYRLIRLWSYATKETQNSYFDELKERFQNYKIEDFISFWTETKFEIQKKHQEVFKYLIENIKDQEKDNNLGYIIVKTSNKILIEYLKNDVLNDDKQFVKLCWKCLDKSEREDLFNKAYRIINGVEPDQEVLDKMKYLKEKNDNIYQTVDFEFIFKMSKYLTKEQLVKLTAYENEQRIIKDFFDNRAIFNAILYILDNDENWTLTLNNFIKNLSNYRSLIEDIGNKDYDEINKDIIIQNLVIIVSDKENYFEIRDYDELKNYTDIKNKVCMDILNGNIDNIPGKLKKYSKDELYKFALLKYKFGISLEDAERIITKYGKDAEELPDGILKDYLKVLKEIVYCEEIEDIIKYAIKKDAIKETWKGFPNAREAEGKIINLYADLYNKTFYIPREEDKEKNIEVYIDSNGQEHKIDIYKIQRDFNMDVRVEGAYNESYKEPDNYKEYYKQPDIQNSKNCETYIGNDSIALAHNSKNSITVGYKIIYKNQLLAGSTRDLGSNFANRGFVINKNVVSDLRIPRQMIDNTRNARLPHNELIKDRIVINENGEVVKLLPNYIVWIEEETEKDRQAPDWHEKREKNEQWLKTKKAAAELEIPIVIIDREYFAKREQMKTDLMKKMITGEAIDEENYVKLIEDYKNLSKPEIIKRLFITIENNKVGMQFNSKLTEMYFTGDKLKEYKKAIFDSIEKMNEEEAKACLKALVEVSERELLFVYSEKCENKNIKIYEEMYYEANNKLNQFYDKKISVKRQRKELFDNMKKIDKMYSEFYSDDKKKETLQRIHQTMLFADVLAEEEGLDENSRKLLSVAVALLKTKKGYRVSSEKSAIFAGEKLRNKNIFEIDNPEEVAIIQTAIHYFGINSHRLDNTDFQKIYNKYQEENNIKIKDTENLKKICELLKIADKLYYEVISNHKLTFNYFRLKPKRQKRIIEYAKFIREKVAERILNEVYLKYEYSAGPVEELNRIRRDEGKEPDLDFYDIYEYGIPKLQNREVKDDLLRLYFKFKLTADDLQNLAGKEEKKDAITIIQ